MNWATSILPPPSLSLSPSTATHISLMRYRREDLEYPPHDGKLGGERGVEGDTSGEEAVDDWMIRDTHNYTAFSFVIINYYNL